MARAASFDAWLVRHRLIYEEEAGTRHGGHLPVRQSAYAWETGLSTAESRVERLRWLALLLNLSGDISRHRDEVEDVILHLVR